MTEPGKKKIVLHVRIQVIVIVARGIYILEHTNKHYVKSNTILPIVREVAKYQRVDAPRITAAMQDSSERIVIRSVVDDVSEIPFLRQIEEQGERVVVLKVKRTEGGSSSRCMVPWVR